MCVPSAAAAKGGVLCCARLQVLGFGAKLPDGQTSHCFSVAGPGRPVEINGLNNVLTAYAESLNFLQLYGPTNFAPVVRMLARARERLLTSSLARP